MNPFKPCLSIEPIRAPSATPLGASAATTSGTGGAMPTESPGEAVGPSSPPLTIEANGVSNVPWVAVYARDPWSMVLGSEVPSFVLYADGTVITMPKEGEPPGRTSGKVADSTALARRLFELLRSEPDMRRLSHATDQPTAQFLLRGEGGWIQRTVYGMAAGCKPSNARASAVPPNIGAMCDAIRDIQLANRAPWQPPQIEVMLWGFEHAKSDGKPWPSTLPPPPVREPPSNGVAHHVIDSKYKAEVDAFRASLQSNQPVLWAGHKWSMGVRSVVPADAFLARVKGETWKRYAEALRRRK